MPTPPPIPPRPELIALLDAVKDNPDEDTPRLVLADWLDEYGDRFDTERATFIRTQIAKPRANLVGTGEERKEFLTRWLGPLVEVAGTRDKRITFSRGLPSLRIHGWRFVKPDVPPLLAGEPFAFVERVIVTGAKGTEMPKIADMPEVRHVSGLGAYTCTFNARNAEKFFASPNLAGLRTLDFNNTAVAVAGADALAANPALARLRAVSIMHSKLVDGVAVALANSRHLANVRYLNLAGNNIGDAGAEALANSRHLADLRELNLYDNPRLTAKGERLLRAKFGKRLRMSGY